MHTLIKNAVETAVPNVSINPKTDFEILKKLKMIPVNRPVDKRVKKMNQHFVKDVKSIHNFTVFWIKNDIVVELNGEEFLIKAGWYVADGNTRILSNKQLNDDTHPSTTGYNPKHDVITKIVSIETPKQFLEEYYSIDNAAATENSGDQYRGGMSLLDIQLNSTRGKAGAFGSAIINAYPGDRKASRIERLAYFRKELILIDKCGVFQPQEDDLATQHFVCAALMTAKLYSEPSSQRDKMVKLLTDISRQEFDNLKTNKDRWNGMTYLVYQSVQPNKHVKNIYDAEYHKSTKFASWSPVVGFMLYCIENHMNDKFISKKGVKPSTSPIKNAFVDTKELLEKMYPTS